MRGKVSKQYNDIGSMKMLTLSTSANDEIKNVSSTKSSCSLKGIFKRSEADLLGK